MGLSKPVNARSVTETITDEQIVIPSGAPFESRLVEVPARADGVKIRRITPAEKTGTGSGVVTSLGHYVGLSTRNYKIVIDTAGEIGVATFKWYMNDELQGSLIPVPDDEPIDLELGVQVRFSGGDGQDFEVGDQFTFVAEFWTEVNSLPVTNKTYQVNYAKGVVTFFSGDAGLVVYASYEGRGSIVKAEDIQQLIDSMDIGELLMRNLDTVGLSANKAVYVKNDGTFDLASAESAATLAIGFIKTVHAEDGEVIVHGRLSGFSGLTPGAAYYLDTDGDITTTPSRAYRQVVGRALSTTTLLVNIILEQVIDEAAIVALKGENTVGCSVGKFVGMVDVGGWAYARAHWMSPRPAVGCVKKSGATDGEIVLFGIVDGFSGLTRGQKYWLANGDGGITSVPPSTPGDIVQVVGIGYSSTKLFVCVEHDYSIVT